MTSKSNLEYSKKELQRKLKKQKLLGLIHGMIVLFLLVIAIINTYNDGISFNTFFPLFFLPMQFVFFYEVKKLKKEIATKN